MEQNTENSPVSPQILKNENSKEHVSNEKPKAPNFRCEECDKDFSIETIYKKHLVTLHDLAKSVQCEQCNETFVEKDELEKRLRPSPRQILKWQLQHKIGYNHPLVFTSYPWMPPKQFI